LICGAPAIEDAEIQEVLATMASGWLGTGLKVIRFENDFKAYRKNGFKAPSLARLYPKLRTRLSLSGKNPGFLANTFSM
jgi:predicted alpha/beta-hydrolase family hydrolase